MSINQHGTEGEDRADEPGSGRIAIISHLPAMGREKGNRNQGGEQKTNVKAGRGQ